jgi:hypothetical protein
MKTNYWTIHKNKKPKKAKYSKPFTKKQYEIMAKMTEWFTEESIKIRNEIHNTYFATR